MLSICHTKTFTMEYSVVELFPLFTPEGKKDWVPGWDYEIIMGHTELYEDYVFLTESHHHGTKGAIWIVKEYNPNSHQIQYYKIEPDDKVDVITVKCTELENTKTKVEVTYKYIALSTTGEKFIAKFNKNSYDEFISEWQKLLLVYFQSIG